MMSLEMQFKNLKKTYPKHTMFLQMGEFRYELLGFDAYIGHVFLNIKPLVRSVGNKNKMLGVYVSADRLTEATAKFNEAGFHVAIANTTDDVDEYGLKKREVVHVFKAEKENANVRAHQKKYDAFLNEQFVEMLKQSEQKLKRTVAKEKVASDGDVTALEKEILALNIDDLGEYGALGWLFSKQKALQKKYARVVHD